MLCTGSFLYHLGENNFAGSSYMRRFLYYNIIAKKDFYGTRPELVEETNRVKTEKRTGLGLGAATVFETMFEEG